MSQLLPLVFGVLAAALHGLGALAALDAIFHSRTSQGAIAWSLSLVIFPYLALPLYLVFGGRKFYGYVEARRRGNQQIQHIFSLARESHGGGIRAEFPPGEERFLALERLARIPFSGGNSARLLVNGEATFKAVFEALDSARDYVLAQFYIVRDDTLGREFRDRLVRAARRGVRVYFLYDTIGSYHLPRSYLEPMHAAGILTAGFTGRVKGRGKPFQVNFRNHRKIVVVDGEAAFVGGHNVGDEYVNRHPKLSPWRDTHVEVRGPAVLGVQLAFLEDWFWMTHQAPPLSWTPRPAERPGNRVLVLPSGPADDLDTCGLMFTQVIHSAKKRLWLVSPYFVPDDKVIGALQLAVLRGVDVRIMLPEKTDQVLVHLAAFTYLEETLPFGIRVFKYKEGFLHQKVFLVDDDLAGVGTANLDNRSFRLNFEITLLFADPNFARRVESMLAEDFSHCRELDMGEIERKPGWFQVSTKLARLCSPVL